MKHNIPVAQKIDNLIVQHNYKRNDQYSWLRDENWKKFIKGDLNFANLEVKKYLDEEANYTKDTMKATEPLQQELYDELLSRTLEDDESCPFQVNEYYYYQKTIKGQSYPILCRKHNTLDAEEEVYFDINTQAKGHKLYIHKNSKVNDANTHLLFAYNLTGSMESTLKIRDLKSGVDLDWILENVSQTMYWLDDENIVFLIQDEFSRGKDLYSMNIYEGPASKKLLFSKPEKYQNRFMYAYRTGDKKVSFIVMSSAASSAIYIKKNKESDYEFLKETADNISYSYEHFAGRFYIVTNDFNNDNFAVYSCAFGDITKSDSWTVEVANSSSVYLKSMSCYCNYLVFETSDSDKAEDNIMVYDINAKKMQTVKFKQDVKYVILRGAHDFSSSKVQVMYQSPIDPLEYLELDLKELSLKSLKKKKIPNFKSENYSLKREFAKAHDGELVPVTIIQAKNFEANKKDNKAFVYAYGSYGFGMPVFFSASTFSLVDRGFSFVIAHIRGGDEKGLNWYLDGKMKNKMNTFKDYISSCEHIINKGYVAEGDIVANGGSAGGLLMGAVANMRPDLFKSVIADVPFVDVINTISDASLPLTPPEWEEWGNPIESKDDYEYMMQYSPYDNIEAKNYPAMLYNSGISDEQVTYWEPAKMVAKLRSFKTDENTLLLNIKMHAGHAGESDRYKGLKEKAFNYAFALSQFNL